MSDSPASIDAILASIRARVLNPPASAAEAADTEPPPPRVVSVVAVPAPPSPGLADIIVPPSTATTTLDDLIRSLLAAQIKSWLDANMPEIVERIAREEIGRLTAKL